MRKVISIYIVLCLVFLACKRPLPPGAYANYVRNPENGLKKNVHSDGWDYIIQYKPADYIILQESNRKNFDVAQRRETLKGTVWFNISFKRSDDSVSPLRYQLTSLQEYEQRQNYFLNVARQNIYLIYGSDSLLPVSYLFENNYNLAPQETMVVGFYLPKGDERPTKNMKLTYIDELFGSGIIKVTFKADDLKKTPALTL